MNKIVYSDRLIKDRIKNFFWMRVLEFNKKGNIHLHKALYIEEKDLVAYIILLGKKLLKYQYMGRSHLTINTKIWSRISENFSYKEIAKNEYLLLKHSNKDFFKSYKKGAGKGLIIEVRSEETKHQYIRGVSRYISKSLLNDQNNESNHGEYNKAVFSFLRIYPFTFKKNVIFSKTTFRKIKSLLIEKEVISKSDKHTLYTLTKAVKSGELRVKNKLEFKSFTGYQWLDAPWKFKKLPKELLAYNDKEIMRHLIFCKSYDSQYFKDFFINIIEIDYKGKVYKINMQSKYQVQMM